MPTHVRQVQPITIPMNLFRPDRPVLQIEAHGDSNEEFGDNSWSFNICDHLDIQADVHGTLRVTATSREEYVTAVKSWFLQGCQRLGLVICDFQDKGSWYEDETQGPSILMTFAVRKA